VSGLFDHRASIVKYLGLQADQFEAGGQRSEAIMLRAQASNIAILMDVRPGRNGIASPVQAIIRETVTAFNLSSYNEVVGASRGSLDTIRVRFAAMWVAKKRLGWGNELLERDFHRDRSTISHGIDRADELRRDDDEFHRLTETLSRQDIYCENCLSSLIPG